MVYNFVRTFIDCIRFKVHTNTYTQTQHLYAQKLARTEPDQVEWAGKTTKNWETGKYEKYKYINKYIRMTRQSNCE